MKHIDDSLARGMAHAFLDHVAESDRICADREERYYRRGRLPRSENLKVYRKQIEHVRGWTPERYRICEWQVQRGKRAIWCDSRLRHCDTGNALTVRVNEVTLGRRAHSLVPRLRITLHAIQRAIQRSGLIRPPFDTRELDPLYAEFNTLPLWLMPALYASRTLDGDDPARKSLLIPADHGVWVCTDVGNNGLLVKTYVGEGDTMWSELERALEQLRGFKDDALAPFHTSICHPDWGWEIDTQVALALHKVWHEWVWLNREREDRPGRDNRAWSARLAERSIAA